ncbi:MULTISPECIES: hypothetical protein [unclassified Streptomyces]|uniref:hypothetical protein n=1 Tax=unclassified Streptomyces TaxID=2593676 RepID=UPI0035E29902
MTVYDYQPVWAGALYDPAPAGGQVSRIDLYDNPGRTGDIVATAGPAVRLRAQAYRFTLSGDLADGRYWCTVTVIPSEGQTPTIDRTVRVDFPLGTGLLVSAEQIADKLGTSLPLTAAQRERYRDAITEAQADIVGYLNRPLIPQARLLRSVRPRYEYGYSLDDARAWPVTDIDDVVTVVSHAENEDGTYDVQLLVGLDGAAEKPITRYLVAHATESIRNGPGDEGEAGRRVTSVSAEGQSLSYEAAPAVGQAGALPALESLSGFRKLLYRPIPVPPAAPWPYGRGRRYNRW